MKHLYLLRHFHAEKMPGESDFSKSLTSYGHKQSKILAEFLDEHAISVDAIIFSPSVRTVSSKNLIVNQVGAPKSIEVQELYQAETETVIQVLKSIDENYSKILVVGHNPSMTSILNEFQIQNPSPTMMNFDVTGKFVGMTFTGKWSEVDVKPANLDFVFFPE